MHQFGTAIQDARKFHDHDFWSIIFIEVQGQEPLPKRRCSDFTLQFVIDHDRAEIEEVSPGPRIIEMASGNRTKSCAVYCSPQAVEPLFVRAYEQD